MAKQQEKKISVNEMDTILEQFFTEQETTVDYYGAQITIKRRLDLRSMLEFASNVTESCFHENYGFMPEMMDFAIRSNLVSCYTNVRLPQNLEKQYDMLYRLDLVDLIYGTIDRQQFDELVASIRKKIDEKNNSNAQTIRQEMQRFMDLMNETFSGAEELFAGENAQDLQKAFQSILEHKEVNEGEIAQAVLSQQEDHNEPAEEGDEEG